MTVRERLANAIWPLILIAAGVVLLLANLDLVDAGIWEIAVDLWPLLVAAAGLNMLLMGGGIFFPLTLIVFAAAFLLDNFDFVDWRMWEAVGRLWPIILVALGLDVLLSARLFGGESRMEEFSQPLEGATSARIKIEPGLGRLDLKTGTVSEALLRGTMALGAGERLSRRFRLRGDEARITLKQSLSGFFPAHALKPGQSRWQLDLNPLIPTTLKIDGGVGVRHLDLSGLTLAHLTVDGGVGATRLTLPAQGRTRVQIDGGLGDTTVRIPAGMAARIAVDSGLGGRQVHGDFVQAGNTYVSPDYETAAQRLDIDIDQGLGSLTIVQA